MPIVRHNNELVLHLFKQITAFINKTCTPRMCRKKGMHWKSSAFILVHEMYFKKNFSTRTKGNEMIALRLIQFRAENLS